MIFTSTLSTTSEMRHVHAPNLSPIVLLTIAWQSLQGSKAKQYHEKLGPAPPSRQWISGLSAKTPQQTVIEDRRDVIGKHLKEACSDQFMDFMDSCLSIPYFCLNMLILLQSRPLAFKPSRRLNIYQVTIGNSHAITQPPSL